jgi:long-subunit acyl-CoA synthetase (AMP-forming)
MLPDLVEYAAERYASGRSLLRYVSGAWKGYSFAAAARAVRALAELLEREGCAFPALAWRFQADNRPEWGLAYLSILATGAIVRPRSMPVEGA